MRSLYVSLKFSETLVANAFHYGSSWIGVPASENAPDQNVIPNGPQDQRDLLLLQLGRSRFRLLLSVPE